MPPPPPAPNLRYAVQRLYKHLLFLGRAYPCDYDGHFRPRLKAAFARQAHLRDEGEIRRGVERGWWVGRGGYSVAPRAGATATGLTRSRAEIEAL